MLCKKCGAEIKEGSKFCAKCGTPVEEAGATETDAGKNRDANEVTAEVQSASTGQSTARKLPAVSMAAGAIVLLLAAVIGVGSFFLFRGKDDSGAVDPVTGDNTVIGENIEDNAENIDWQEMIPLYTIEDVPSVNIHEQNYTAAAKAPGIAWDSTLFYWLEDVDQTSSEDGYLARCPISKMLLRNAESGNIIQYEIYRDPNSSEIYKIVSIEQVGEALQLVDYYYQGGVPNFIFSRSDSIYTPTYATPAKVGERYYFNGDVMARWRMIREPNVIGEYVLAPTGASYSQADYYAESAELQAIYDNTELRELNAARNTFDAVTAAGNGIGMVEGRVTDTAGNSVAGVTVDILRAEDGALLYRSVTDEDGSFSIFVYLEDVECSIVIRGDETYDSNSIHGVMLARSNGGSSYGNLLMHRLDGDEYPVHINVYSAVDVRTGEDGSLLRDLLPGAEVSLRAGAGARTGEELQTLQADANGYLDTTLSSGTYTAQVDAPGYATAYLTVEVMEQETTAEGYVLPALVADQAGIVMTWEGDADLDLTLFTPYQSTNGDMAHIGGRITEDGYGNSLVADNAAGCEVMYVNTAVLGNYKLYVNNYTESEAGNYSSSQLSTLNIHIYIYNSNGLLAEYSFPAGQIGVVWEVADLNGGQVTPSQRVYVSLEGKSWWTENKEKMVLVKEIRYGQDNSIIDWVEYSYNASGNIAQKTWYYYDGIVRNWHEYSYDASGNLVRIAYDGEVYNNRAWTEYSYDVSGNLVRETGYDADGSIISWTEYSYNTAGNVVWEASHRADGSISNKTEYSYDESGNLVEKASHSHINSYIRDLDLYYWYSYDAAGNLIQEICDDGSQTEYIYDAAGNLIEENLYDSNGYIYEWYFYSYDAAGNLVLEQFCNARELTEYIYAPLNSR